MKSTRYLYLFLFLKTVVITSTTSYIFKKIFLEVIHLQSYFWFSNIYHCSFLKYHFFTWKRYLILSHIFIYTFSENTILIFIIKKFLLFYYLILTFVITIWRFLLKEITSKCFILYEMLCYGFLSNIFFAKSQSFILISQLSNNR